MKPIISRVAGHLRANVVAYLALFVSLSASAYALPKVGSNDIKPNAVKSKHVKAESLSGTDIADGSQRLAELAAWKVTTGNLSTTIGGGECSIVNSGVDARIRPTDFVLAAPAPGAGATPDGITLDAAMTETGQVTPLPVATLRICNVTNEDIALPNPYSARLVGLR